jgi:hypothetical protein
MPCLINLLLDLRHEFRCRASLMLGLMEDERLASLGLELLDLGDATHARRVMIASERSC